MIGPQVLALRTQARLEVAALFAQHRYPVPGVGERFRAARKEKGWTQEEAAKRIGVPRTYLSAIECGLRDIELASVFRYAAGLGVDPVFLAFGKS